MPRVAEILSLCDLDDTWLHSGELAFNAVFIGPVGEPTSPVGVVLRATRDAGDLVAGRRTHTTPSTTVVLEGAVQLDGRWMREGDLFIAPAGEVHGDLVIGPDGAVVFIFFAERRGLVPAFADAEDRAVFDASFRADVEKVASGGAEVPVVLLPPRKTYSSRRGVVVTDLAEIAALKARQAAGESESA